MIRALVQQKRLSPEQQNYLEERLLATLDGLAEHSYEVLERAFWITQLLEVIDRPIDRDRYRSTVHGWLREFHSKKSSGFQLAGGFKITSKVRAGSLKTTYYAVELMKIFGVPDGLDLNLVRSFLRPMNMNLSDQKWISAATRKNLDRLPGVSRPSLLTILYYERSLLTALMLVGFCIYATLSSPRPQQTDEAEKLQQKP